MSTVQYAKWFGDDPGSIHGPYDDRPPGARRVTAVLGPTNTGKTHHAIERMLAHDSGMIGFPLRLLARETYDRICRQRPVRDVALITGEEKILPRRARYFVCTVESMPLDRPVAFLAVDEIQLIGDRERGHTFTDRLLHARGQSETLFLGSDTARPLIRMLVPEATFTSRPRFSSLTHAGPKKLTRLPRRSAVVAFSAAEVYAVAELIRRQRGGTAVVMGALSPRARNAQVAMYQAGEVDYLVATDAIGMGLNMDLDHVAFAQTRKFDGRRTRRLTNSEMGQIAGRAGRHMADGTFGTTADAGRLDEETVEAIESHRFAPLRFCQWRNSDLDFCSARALLRSLEEPVPHRVLRRTRDADDHRILASLIETDAVMDRCTSKGRVMLLWDLCQVPDFQKSLTDTHTQLVATLFQYLTQGHGRLPADWVSSQIRRLDRADGDIDTLTARLARVRTWTYIAHRADWLEEADHWRNWARGIEDKLSDALHDRLTQRFVDRRITVLTRRLEEGDDLLGAIDRAGAVLVEGYVIGQLAGFTFTADDRVVGAHTKPLMSAARRVLSSEIPLRLARCVEAPDSDFELTDRGRLLWKGAVVAHLGPGDDVLTPRVVAPMDTLLDSTQQEHLKRRLAAFLATHLEVHLAPLLRLRRDGVRRAQLSGPGRGLAFQVHEALGGLPAAAARAQIEALTPGDRQILKRLGVTIGFDNLFLPGLMKPASARLRGLLWSVAHRQPSVASLAAERVSLEPDERIPAALYRALGYRRAGPRWLRIDMHDRLVAAVRRHAVGGAFEPSRELLALAGCRREELADVLLALGCRRVKPAQLEKARRRAAAATGDTADGGETVVAPRSRPASDSNPARSDAAHAAAAAREPTAVSQMPDMFVLKLAPPPRTSTKGVDRTKARWVKDDEANPVANRKTRKARSGRKEEAAVDPDSPFAKLRELRIGR